MFHAPPRKRLLLILVAFLALALAAGFALRSPSVASAIQIDPVTAAWNQARAAGSYAFSSDIVQITMPTAKITNVGRSSRSEELHLEGQNDLRQQNMEMQLWSDGGSAVQPESSTGVKITDGKTFVRQGTGEWQEKPDFAVDSLAPQGDFMAYLVALRDVQAHAPEQRGGIHFTRYSFTLDGPTFALYIHEQMERTLRAKGELPPNTQLEVPRYYAEMTGDGELWVGTDGLPLRQILHLQFPPQKEEQVQAQMVIDFSNYGAPLISPWARLRTGDLAGLWASLPAFPTTVTTYLPPTLLILTALLGVGLVLRYRRRRLLETALAFAVITSMVVGPVLSTMLNVRFFDAQSAKAAAQDEQQAAADQDRELRDALGKVEFNPHRNPLESAASDTLTMEAAIHNPQSAISLAPAALPTDSTLDTDSDGLSDFVEERVGTNHLAPDTDTDGLPDNQEVRGFSFGGKTWYLNAAALDSNGDGLSDGIEWGLNADGTLRTTPQDTDTDQMPDLFDLDNDNDGVPDNKDLAPFVVGASTLNETNPLQLRLNNLTPGKPTVVEFQIRPQDPKHLWFAFNVLDWPQDSAGQMQDIDGFTYADYAKNRGRVADANEANGDMKLVPMLEIRMASADANLPPQADLTPFNINVRNATSDGQSKVVYVPINVVKDERTGQRVAFSAQMRYQPTGTWTNAHSVRLAWVVQNLVDLPCDPQSADAVAAGCQADGYIRNVPQPIHSYYDSWTLTGLTVREDHGSTVDIIYEDPDVDANKRDDAALVALSFVLDHHFVLARDTNNDGRRDLTVDEIANRFDRTRNSGYSEDQRFAVANILRVEKQSYPTLEQAVATTAMTETQKVLAKFVSASTADRTVKPLLFFAQESNARMVTLDALRAGGGSVVQSGANLTLDMAPAGQPAQTVDVTASIKWSAFCGSAATPLTWQACTSDEYWGELERRYGTLAPLPTDESPDWVGGRLQLTQLYYTGLTNGYYSIVQRGTTVSSYSYSLDGESTTTSNVRASLQGLSTLPIEVGLAFERSLRLWLKIGQAGSKNIAGPLYKFGAELRKSLKNSEARLKAAAPGSKNFKFELKSVAGAKLAIFKFYNSPIATVGAVFTSIAQIVSLSPDVPLTTRTVVGALSLVSNLALNVVITGIEVGMAIKAGVYTLRSVLTGAAQVSKGIRVGGMVGLAINVALTWSFFIYAAVENGASAGSPELNKAFFEAVAATLVAVFLFVLSLTVVGLLVVLIVAVIDGLLTLICELGVDELRNAPGLGGACFTLNTAAVKAIAYFLYNYDLMIDLSRQDLLVTGTPDLTLLNPSLGYQVGNALSVSLPVTTTVVHKDPDSSVGIYINFFLYLFSQSNLKSSTFRYSLSHPNAETLTVARDQMSGEWRDVREDHKYLLTPMYRGYTANQPSYPSIPLSAAGINRPVEFYLNYGYAVPAYECVGVPNILPFWIPPVIPLCYVRESTGSDSNKIDAVKFDVFPATLDGFMSLGNKENGLGLGWDAAFPALLDADGDGLRAAGKGGLDPADNNTDSDGDGLSDTFEVEMQTSGVVYSPILRDTDLDGLTDRQESLYGTNPANADTDNDGLTDGQEVWHSRYDNNGNPTTLYEGGWDVRINATSPLLVHVSSDPNAADSDNDGLSDLAEKQLAEATCTAQEVANGRACEGNPLKPVDNQNRPFHPNVTNTPPLALLLATDDFDGFLAPGQTVRYTTTAIANAPLSSGVLNVLPPLPPFTAQPAAVALPFDSLTFSGSQTLTVPSNLTVQSGVATQKVAVTSKARTRLASSSGPAWSFDAVTPESALAGFAAPLLARNTGISANRSDRTDSYLLSSLLSSAATAGGAGDVQAYTLPNGTNRALESDNLNKNIFRGANPPRSATNNRGDSLVVWDQVENCRILNITLLTIVTAGPDHGTSGIEPFITVRDSVGNQDVQVWRWDSVRPVDLQVGTYGQGFPVTVNVCGDYTLKMWESDGTDNSVGAISRTQAQDLNGTVTFEGSGHKIAIDVNTPYRDDYTVAGALVGADGSVKQRLTFSPPSLGSISGQKRRSYNPIVASDGTDFLVIYEARLNNDSGQPFLISQPVSVNGTSGSPTAVEATRKGLNPFTSFDTESKLSFALVWMDRFYRLVYQYTGGDTSLWRRDFLPSGPPSNNQTVELTNNSRATQPSFAASWDPISGRWALAYIRNDSGRTVELLGYPSVRTGSNQPHDTTQAFLSPYEQVDLDWNPLNGGWLFQGQLTDNRQVFVALDNDFVQRAESATQVSWTGSDAAGLALACPVASALPVLDLRFEELPGAISFVDSSGRNNNAICGSASQCPVAGTPGGVYANGTAIGGGAQGPSSDYALGFNSNQYLRVPDNDLLDFDSNRSFTWLAWVKTTVGSPIMRKGLGGTADLLLSITSDTGRLRMGFGNINSNILTANAIDLRDNQWHQVAVTLDRVTNTATLYVDGLARSSGTFSGSFVTSDDLFVGSSNLAGYIGALDNLQIYHSALAADTITALYDRTTQAYCVGSTPTSTGNGVQWAKLVVRQPDRRGGAITVSNSISLTVDSDPPTANLTSVANNQTVQGGSSSVPRVLVIGGSASDPTSGVTKVEVSVNNGPWQLAEGAESWSFALTLGDGQYAIRARATDGVGNLQSTLSTVTLYADGTLPQMSVTTDLNVARRTFRTIDARYTLLLQGTASDPVTSGSGSQQRVAGQVQLFNAEGQAVSLPQPVSCCLFNGSWQIFYQLPDGEKAPSGRYSLELQATDGVGNQFKQRLANIVLLDGLGPIATLTTTNVNSGALTNIITDTVTIGGQISETGKLASATLSFTPIQQVLPYADSVLQLNLEERSPGTTAAGDLPVELYADNSTQFNHALCISKTQCPFDNVPGRVGKAARFSGNQYLRVRNHPTLNFDANTSFSWQVWIKTNSNLSTNPILRKGLGGSADLMLSLNESGQAQMGFGNVTSSSRLFAGPNLRDNQWHQIVVTLNRPNNRAELYIDGVGYGGGGFPGNFTTPDDLFIGSGNFQGYEGTLDQIAIFRHALSAAEVAALYKSVSRPVYPFLPPANWTYSVPAGLEGLYQIDMPAADTAGNELPNGNLWRGMIDNVAPRVAISGTATGQSVLDANNVRQYEVKYSCLANDWQLDESKFNCPGNATQPASRGFNSDPILQSQFPTLTLLSTLSNTWTVWQPSNIPSGTLTACDTTGKCSTATLGGAVAASGTDIQSSTRQHAVDSASVTSYQLPVTTAEVAAVPSTQPNAEIINPTDGSFVGSTDNVEVVVAAEAAKTLKEVTLLLDGEVAATIPFARIDKVTVAQQSVELNLSAGAHTLEARASDWTGATQPAGTPVRFTVVSKEPSVALGKTNLTLSDTYQAQSGIVIIQGTVDNVANLATVQVKVGDQPYADALVKDGVWGIAYPVLDPENRNLAISVRAIDKAGQITKIGQEANTDFASGVVPETTITAQPGNDVNATIGFTGTVGNEVATAFECKLDEGAFTACTTPVEYKNLSNGAHNFQVHAINSQGTQDATPAEVKWTVQGEGKLVEIESAPAATSTSRSARFEFEVAGEDEDEQAQCSLDGSAFTACASPATYSNLADGVHTFQVRVEGNPASKVSWRVSNSAPIAASQVVTTAQNSKVPVTLVANDESSLKYVILSKPTNGTLSGTGANLVYQPGTDFFGTDSFSFKADDGDATSNLATVTINVTPQAGQGGLQRDSFVVFGSEGVILRENVKVMSGDIGASLSSNGPWLGDGAEVSIGSGVVFADAKSKVLGDTLFVGQGTAVSNANYNELRGPGSVKGNKVTPQALPLLNRFVAMPGIGVGKQNVDVASAGSANGSVTLAPGNYLSLNVAKGGEVIFSGGVYSFKEWVVADNTKLTFAAASEIRISGRAIVGEHSYVGPAPSSAVTAKQIVIYVAGVNANTAVLGGLGAKAATFGPYATLAANVVAPNGTLLIRERSKAVGSFVARWVSVGKFSELTLANRFSPSTVEGRVDGYVNLTLDDATGINSTAALSPNVNDELLSEEGTNEENPEAGFNRVYLPVISSGTVGSETVDSKTVDSESEDSKPVDVAPKGSAPNEEEATSKLFLPAVSR